MVPHQKYRIGTIRNIKLLGWGLKSVLQAPYLTLILCSGSQHYFSCSVLVVNLLLINESSRTNKLIMITTWMNQKRGLNRFRKLPEDGNPWAPNYLLKKNTIIAVDFVDNIFFLVHCFIYVTLHNNGGD